MTNKAILQQIPLENLIQGQYQPRQYFDDAQLDELAEAIKATKGLLQPIIVRQLDVNKYEIIAGERRWRAAMRAGFETVSCIIRDFSDIEALEAAIIENVNRTDLNPIEEAQAYERLMLEFNYTHEEIASSVGKSRSKVTNILRLLKLDSRVQHAMRNGEISEGHGKILASLPLAFQYDLAQKIIKKGLSVRTIEQEVKRLMGEQEKPNQKDANLKALERALSDHVGCAVKIECNANDQQGKLEVHFHNLEILEGLFAKMGFSFQS